MKISLVTTILNEEKSIIPFLNSISDQSIVPDEVIIVDGGSIDGTISLINNFKQKSKKIKKLTVCVQKGNRSIGRNEGVKKASNEIILLSDAGCFLDRDWVKNIIAPFSSSKVDVVAGYYAAKTSTIFQKCLVPYVLVMPDKVDSDNFLPATRSMALRKSVWSELYGFNEGLSHNEDYEFARRLRKAKKTIAFSREAIAYWIPRNTFYESYVMFRRFAFGDIEAGIIRPKVVILFVRYVAGISLLLLAFYTHNIPLEIALVVGVVLYCLWAIQKNYKYIKDVRALYYLPMLQFTADVAVINGSLKALFTKYGL